MMLMSIEKSDFVEEFKARLTAGHSNDQIKIHEQPLRASAPRAPSETSDGL
jgi:hypothetical protein